MSEFNDLDITGLAVLIGRIIGNIDLILLFPDRVPFVLERTLSSTEIWLMKVDTVESLQILYSGVKSGWL